MTVLAQVVEIAREAGAAIMAIYADETRWAVQEKDDASPLTAADIAAHRLIKTALQVLTPDIPLLSEESTLEEILARRDWRRCWVVDPLDGTKEFLKRNGDFTVNIALLEGHEVVLGVIYAPAKNQMYWAQQGRGAFKEENGQGRRIHCAPLGAPPVRLVTSRHHRDPHGQALLGAIEREFGAYTLANMGSAFKMCLVAEGAADCCPRFGPTMEWDTAAAQILLEEAGGALISPGGDAFRYNERSSLTNGGFLAVGSEPERWLRCWPQR